MKAETSPLPLNTPTQKTCISWPHMLLVIPGVIASGYAIHVHNLIKAGQDTGCGISEGISCDQVIGSQWGEFFGIPLGFYGLIFWAIVAVTSISGANVSPKSAALQRLAVATVGILSSIGFSYIAYVIIGKFCPVCAATHTLTLINFLVALILWVKTRKASQVTA